MFFFQKNTSIEKNSIEALLCSHNFRHSGIAMFLSKLLKSSCDALWQLQLQISTIDLFMIYRTGARPAHKPV